MSSHPNVCELCNCSCEIRFNSEKISSNELLPKDLCLLAFHSIFPYLLTLSKKGWFNWVGHREHVIVNCPSTQGISMYVKSSSNKNENIYEAEIMQTRGKCAKGHQLGDVFSFKFDSDYKLKYELLDKAVPYLSKMILPNREEPLELAFVSENETFQFQVKFQNLFKK